VTERNGDDRDRRVASGFPDPADVPGPTERLRQVHGGAATEPKPKYGRASASTAGSNDYVPLDEMTHASSGLADGAVDRVSAFARRVGDDLADRLRTELDARGATEIAKTAGVGVAELGAAGILGLGAIGASATAMIFGLNKVMPAWASSLVVAGVFGLPAGILASRGIRHVKVLATIGAAEHP
jgi:Putative Actinobacterial Holin-X, holin superfamily III